MLSTLLLFPFLLPQEPLSVTLTRVAGKTPTGIASAQVPLPPFHRVADQLTTTAKIAGRSMRLECPASEAPPAQVWVDADGDGQCGDGESLSLPWDGSFAELDLSPFGIDARLMFFRGTGTLKATLRTLYHFAGQFTIGEVPWAVRWIDMDASGTPSPGDRWLALPKAQLDTIGAGNSMFVGRETNEPWHAGARELRVVEVGADGRLQLSLAACRQPRHEFLAEHNARISAWFGEQFDTEGDEFLVANGIDRTRPKTTIPIAWYHTLEFADAQRHAQAAGRPLLVEFSTDGCAWCKRLPWLNYRDAAVAARLRQFDCVRIDCDLDPDHTAAALGLVGVPNLVVFDAEGKVLHKGRGWQPPADHVKTLDAAIAAAGLPPVVD